MKAIKKWLMDKEGIFIVITWWIILFVVFTILLGVNINTVSKNSKITAETSQTYIHEFIHTGDVVYPYSEYIKSGCRYDEEKNHYIFQINEYNSYSTKEHKSTIKLTGDATATASVELDLEVIDVFAITYNQTLKTATIDLVTVKTEVTGGYDATIKATPSGELHILWNNEDTGVVYNSGDEIVISRSDENLVINGNEINTPFSTAEVKYTEVDNEEEAKTIPFDLIVEYKIGTKSFITQDYNTDGLTDLEKDIIADSANYFTELIEESVGISKSAFTLVIVSSIVDVVLLAFGVFGIVALKRSKED